MFSLPNHVRDNFYGMLVIGDLHADLKSLQKAHAYAKSHNLFLLSLGDVVDRGSYPYECVYLLNSMMELHAAGLVSGNHDDKYRRLALGNKVRLSVDQHKTLEDVGEDRKESFLKMYCEMQEYEGISGIYYQFGDLYFVHAASHDDMWNNRGKFGSEAKSRALYGEVTGEVEANGMPVRLYNWINEIPIGKTVMVGHDRKPIHNVAITDPLIVKNSNGGQAIFIDTGCGKGGFLTGAIVTADKKGYNISSYVTFKDVE